VDLKEVNELYPDLDQVHGEQEVLTTIQSAIEEAWEQISTDRFDAYHKSMQGRCELSSRLLCLQNRYAG